MKRWVAALLLASMLFGQTELHQVLRIPAFIHHFMDHCSEDASTTLFQFVVLHYFTDHARTDLGHHDQLPFAKHQHYQAIPSVTDLFHEMPSGSHLDHPSVMIHSEGPADGPVMGTYPTVWQPPRA